MLIEALEGDGIFILILQWGALRLREWGDLPPGHQLRGSGVNITLPTKVHLVKVMVFPVVMYGCES